MGSVDWHSVFVPSIVLEVMLRGIKLMFGADPKKEYKDKVAKVELG